MAQLIPQDLSLPGWVVGAQPGDGRGDCGASQLQHRDVLGLGGSPQQQLRCCRQPGAVQHCCGRAGGLHETQTHACQFLHRIPLEDLSDARGKLWLPAQVCWQFLRQHLRAVLLVAAHQCGHPLRDTAQPARAGLEVCGDHGMAVEEVRVRQHLLDGQLQRAAAPGRRFPVAQLRLKLRHPPVGWQ